MITQFKALKDKVKTYVHKHWNNKEAISHKKGAKIAVALTICGISFGALGMRSNAYAISVNGEVVAIVKEKEIAKSVVENVVATIKDEEGVDITLNETLAIEQVNKKSKAISTVEGAAEAINKAISYQIQAYAIQVDGKQKVIVESKEVAMRILEDIATRQLPATKKATLTTQINEEVQVANIRSMETPVEPMGGEKQELIEIEGASKAPQVVEEIHVGNIEENPEAHVEEQEKSYVQRQLDAFDFNEAIEVMNIYVEASDIQTEEEARNVLLSNTDEIVEYELKEGDNIWDIAMANGTTMEHILEINPQIEDETCMQIGEIIKLEVPDPVVSLAMTETVTYKEMIPMEIEYEPSDDLYKDQTKVKVEGADGKKEMTVLYKSVNGKEISRETLAEKVLEEPVTKVILYGTKARPKNGASESVKAPAGLFMHPLNGKGRISSSYGYRGSEYHKGIDIAAPAGTPIYAAAAGKVIYASYNSGGYGKMIIIDHGNGYKTYYAHNSSLYVRTGDQVSKGENIAGVGNTGMSTGNHLHFEIRKNGNPINPYGYIY
ncbi:hypothetical protein CS063_01895 [Sporanaerobium hydrogeniformans]|uniref:Uncharacterized protein n=1 Tax=Sporanaerobium hydrogeniformans TaxID=3072179 RepID=A0AC61DH42_9FIRM|nr:M23 family metallopeptidase [Sporanaerobium hydrogeniformans]PHV72252.1 hypothetical protein CS063_01895 [Sporanaerobium hydrogeniformans]